MAASVKVDHQFRRWEWKMVGSGIFADAASGLRLADEVPIHHHAVATANK
jgi:hypothetical protein